MAPPRRRQAAFAFLAAALILLPGAFFGLPNKPMAGAQRVLEGEVIYRDFWTIYGPGSYYAIAGLCAVLGRTVLVPAVAGVLLRALGVGLFFALLRRLGAGARGAWGLALLLALALFETTPELGTYAGILPAVLGALLLALGHVREGGDRRVLLAGLVLGLGATFKHDVAAYAGLAISAGLLAAGRPLRSVGLLAAGAVAVLVPVVLLLAWAAGPDAWRDLVVFPAGDFRLVRSEPYPGLLPDLRPLRAWLAEPSNLAAAKRTAEGGSHWILTNAPQIAFPAALVFVIRRWGRLAPGARAIAVAALVALPLHWMAAHVQQNTHLTTMAILSFVLGVIAWNATDTTERGWRRLALALLVLWAPALLVRPLEEARRPFSAWSARATLDLPVARGLFVAPARKQLYERLAAFVHANVPPGEAIHVGVQRHDAIIVNDTRLYYVVDRPCATRYHELHPGVADVAHVQREMIADLEQKGVRCVVLWSFGGGARSEAAADRLVERRRALGIEGIGSPLLDDHIARHFAPVFEVDGYTILWRRDQAPPVVP